MILGYCWSVLQKWGIPQTMAIRYTSPVGGIPTPLKNMMKVSWDDELPKIWKVLKKLVPVTTNQLIRYTLNLVVSNRWSWGFLKPIRTYGHTFSPTPPTFTTSSRQWTRSHSPIRGVSENEGLAPHFMSLKWSIWMGTWWSTGAYPISSDTHFFRQCWLIGWTLLDSSWITRQSTWSDVNFRTFQWRFICVDSTQWIYSTHRKGT